MNVRFFFLSICALNAFSLLQASVDVAVSAQVEPVTVDNSGAAVVDQQKQITKAIEEERTIYLNFENSSLLNFVNYMAERKNINLIPDKGLENSKVSLTTRKPLNLTEAWDIFLTILDMSGFAIVESGSVFKVVPRDKRITEPLPIYINTKVQDLPDNDGTIRYVTFLENIRVDTIKDLLTNMLSANASVYPYKEANGFVIADKAMSIKTAIKVLEHLDTMGQPESVVVIRLRQANATDVHALLDSLIKKQDAANPLLARFLGANADTSVDYFPQGTKIVLEERTNSLILLGPSAAIKKIEDFIVNYVDTALKEVESPLHIYELQYTEAVQMAEILKQVTDSSGQAVGQQAAKFGAVRGGVKYFKAIKFVPEKSSNRLLISCTDDSDWKLIKKTIQDLDKPQPQIALEMLVVNVQALDVEQLAGALRNKKHGVLGKGIDIQTPALTGAPTTEDVAGSAVSLLGNLLPQLIAQQGATLLSFGQKLNIWAVLEMLKQNTNANIVTQAFLTIANKAEGTLINGKTQFIPTSTTGSGSNLTGYTEVAANQTFIITPQINLDGIIQLDINMKNKSFTGTDDGASTDSSVKTQVTIANGQALILCGTVSSQIQETKAKTPILGDIPLVGWFFKGHSVTKKQEYQFIFLSPTIVKPRTLPGVDLYTKMKLHSAASSLEDAVESGRTRDPLANWFFDTKRQNYSRKIMEYADGYYQPISVDIKNDPYYRSNDQDRTYVDQNIAIVSDGSDVQKIEKDSSSQPVVNDPNHKVLADQLKDFVAPHAQGEALVVDKKQESAVKEEIELPKLPADATLDQKRQRLKDLVSFSVLHEPQKKLEVSENLKESMKQSLNTVENSQSVEVVAS